MAQLINLYGVQTLTPTTDNNFSLVYDGNVRSENNNEVRILVDTSLQVVPAPVNIYLPPINSFKGIWTLQLYVVDVSGSAGTNPINIIATGGDNVDGVAQTQVSSAYGNCVLTIASFGYWTTYGSASGGGGGGGGMITTTFANFYNTMSQGNLIAGANYRITDYQSKNFINGWDSANNNTPQGNLSAGAVITTFNNPSTATGLSSTDDAIFCLPDGTSFIANGDKVRKYDVNGVEIPSFFNNQGTGGGSYVVSGINVQSSGKVIIVGYFTLWDGNPVGRIARLNADGTYDPTFTANVGTGTDNGIITLDIQTDDSILIGGFFNFLNGVANNYFARILSDGTPDLVFNANLMVGGGFNNLVFKVIIQPDTNILICGWFNTFNGLPATGITRIDTFGNSDVVFDANVNFAGGFNGNIISMALQTDGSIVVSGFFTVWNGLAYNRIARMFFDGTDDVAFNLNCGTGLTDNAISIAIQNDGYILLSTSIPSSFNTNPFNSLCRIDPFGNFDTQFYYTIGGNSYAVKIQPTTNRILVGVGSGNYYYALNPLPTANTNFVAREVYTSPNVEVLIVKATDGYNIEQNVYSEQYPLDIIEYLPQVNNLGFDFDIYTGQTLPDSTPVVSFNLQWDGTQAYIEMPTGYPVQMGHYLYIYASFGGGSDSIDLINEPTLFGTNYPIDYNDGLSFYSSIVVNSTRTRIYLPQITNAQFLTYDLDSLYVEGIYAYEPCTGWITRRNNLSFGINYPADWRNQVFRRWKWLETFTPNSYPIYSAFQIGFEIPPYSVLSGEYEDRKCFTNDSNDVYASGLGGASPYWYTGYTNNNTIINAVSVSMLDNFGSNTLDGISNSKVGSDFVANTINYLNSTNVGRNFVRNFSANFTNFVGVTFGDTFQTNFFLSCSFNYDTFGYSCVSNILKQVSMNYNEFGVGFSNNLISNAQINRLVVGYNANNNVIGTFGGTPVVMENNTFLNVFQANNIQTSFYTNTFGNNFRGNIINGSQWVRNTGGDVFSDNSFNIGGLFTDNAFGNYTSNNTFESQVFVENRFGDNCQNNYFSPSSDVRRNLFGNKFFFNGVLNNFLDNKFTNDTSNNSWTGVFTDCSCGSRFTNNVFTASFNNNNVFGDDCTVFNVQNGSFYNNKFGNRCTNNYYLNPVFHDNSFGDGFSTNDFRNGQFYNISAGNNFASNQIRLLMIYTSFGNDCISNQFLGQVSGNVFGDFCQTNVCGASSNLQNNILSLNFSSNTIDSIFHDNKITAICQLNTFPFSTVGNTISGTTFSQNAIQTTFSHNVITYTMVNCITAGGGGVSFRFNDIQSDLTSVNFSLATFVYASYNKTIQRGNLGTSILTYWNEGTNTYSWALPTA